MLNLKNIDTKIVLKVLFTGLLMLDVTNAWAQNNPAVPQMAGQKMFQSDSQLTYFNQDRYEMVELASPEFAEAPKNVILFIGDGLGVTHVSAALTVNGGQLNLNHMKHIGFSQTQSKDRYVTDSAAGGTAIATGQRVNNGAIAMDASGEPIPSILHISEQNGKATGLVATSDIAHATPASFIAHQPSRSMYEEIAADFLKTDIDLFIGGGLNNFANRSDGVDLTLALKEKGYQVFYSLEESACASKAPMAVFTAPGHNPEYDERGNMLELATKKAIEVLSKDENGFFVMIEGSQIDWASHHNITPYLLGEVLDLDKAVGVALEFAAQNGETLVIVTSDHETGGLALHDGSYEHGFIEARYSSDNHTGVMVPVFAYGPGAELFLGIYDNTDIFHKIHSLFGF